ncbi:hypothetical protein OGAPHI_005119 [Ogataea philodendri]|uniref:Uncharacterized protein n=1 Tax=Ogataea philodendri TaxID=1378263 RepID=A0A9P8P1B5_9ASCO|nr:uncharacterized protein OGAPHI_005119 [Ogataea philodendri]KAH3663718.1 hypothetical protein OGAPHI_005119 [Ogataea philodendri]
MSFLNTSVQLLYISGTRVPLLLDEDLITNGLGEDPAHVRIGNFRNYIFDHWEELVNSGSHGGMETSNSDPVPEVEEQVQLIHLGSRLDPNELLSTLNFGLSPIVHIIVKPFDQLPANSHKDRIIDLKLSANSRINLRTNKRRGSTSNTPVPQFVPQPKIATSVTHQEDVNSQAKRSNELSELSKTHTENIPSEDMTAKDNAPEQPIARSSNHDAHSPPNLPSESSKSGCCIIV